MNLFLANRFFRNNSQRKRKASVPAIHIATLGVALGLVVMILSVCVVRGFKFEITNKLTGFASHIEILDINSFSSPESYPISVNPQLISKISHLPNVEKVQYRRIYTRNPIKSIYQTLASIYIVFITSHTVFWSCIHRSLGNNLS